ncbi:c-type cytochrome [Pandoraea commovens]|uniref:C-type cytochrome n=1 Tax=Pandoraea commovens TaxID=2508289 RepID=A0A5E4WHR3_9BURK|nr:c-type cytochrome [Pandoraea commovens]UVA80769.1 c-type cytochrome [Pandoraea commovens]VVE23060.1 Cytochrome c-551 [Pandoraea commovens]
MKGFAGVRAGTMMSLWLMAAATAYAQSAPQSDVPDHRVMEKLARARNCMTCHATDRTLLAPSYRDIAKRYAGQPGATEELTRSISDGSQGKWGKIPMPAGLQLAPGEANDLARWILGMVPGRRP